MAEEKDFGNLLLKSVEAAVKSEIDRIVNDSVEEAKKELENKIPEIVAGISVSIMGLVDMSVMQNKIVFEIRKEKNI